MVKAPEIEENHVIVQKLIKNAVMLDEKFKKTSYFAKYEFAKIFED